jgi:predicted  nucleic acid-binding Zn-ribbon protein
MTKSKDEPESDETPDKPTPSLTAIAKKLDAAVKEADTQREALATAQAALDTAQQELAATMARIQELAQEHKTILDEILTAGGTIHA